MQTVAGHPIFGHLDSFRTDRAGALKRLALDHDAVNIRMGFIRNLVVIGSPALAHEILAGKAGAFGKGPGLSIFLKPALGSGLLTSEGDYHAAQRKLLAPAFAHKRVASYAQTMSERADRFAAALSERDELDLADAMTRLTLEIVGKTLFDAEIDGDAAEVGDALTTVMKCAMGQLGSIVPVPPIVPTPANLRYRRAVARLDKIVYRMIGERRSKLEDRGDVLSTLLAARDEDGTSMTDVQIRDESMTLVLAGHETTANALAWTFFLLGKHPEIRSRLETELDALGRAPSHEDLAKLPFTLAVLKESMRLYPPAYLIARRALRDVTIGRHAIPSGTVCLISVIGIHHRPDIWPDPERFDPERFLGDRDKELPRCAYMPFGAGPRICIGNHFALMEGQVLLATIARRVRFELASRVPVELDPLVTLRPKGGVPVRVSVRDGAR